MEPFDGAVLVVAGDHLAEGDLVTEAVDGLVRVDGHVEDIALVVGERQGERFHRRQVLGHESER